MSILRLSSLLILSGAAVNAQMAPVVTTVHSPRPVLEALNQITARYTVPVTYEDTRYRNPVQFGSATSILPTETKLNPNMNVLKPVSLTFALSMAQSAAQTVQFNAAVASVKSAVDSYNHDMSADMLGVLVANNWIHVTRKGFITKLGTYEPENSALNQKVTITIPNGTDIYSAVDKILNARVSPKQKITPVFVMIGVTPKTDHALTFTRTSARDALQSLSMNGFAGQSAAFTWQLLCDDTDICFFNIVRE